MEPAVSYWRAIGWYLQLPPQPSYERGRSLETSYRQTWPIGSATGSWLGLLAKGPHAAAFQPRPRWLSAIQREPRRRSLSAARCGSRSRRWQTPQLPSPPPRSRAGPAVPRKPTATAIRRTSAATCPADLSADLSRAVGTRGVLLFSGHTHWAPAVHRQSHNRTMHPPPFDKWRLRCNRRSHGATARPPSPPYVSRPPRVTDENAYPIGYN